MFIPNSRRITLLICLVAALTTTGQGSMELVYPLNLHRIGVALPLLGAAIALGNLGQLISRFPGGAAYSLGRARLLNVGSQALAGLSTVCLALPGGWGMQAALAGLHGLAFGLVTTFQLATLIDARPRDRPMAGAIAWYTAAISAGYALGAPLGAQSILAFGHPGAFVVSGSVNLAAACLSLLVVPGTSGPHPGPPPRTRGPREIRGSRGVGVGRERNRLGLAGLGSLPAGVWLAALIGLYINLVNDAQGAFFPIYAVGAGISVAVVGFLKSAQSISATGVRFLAAGLFRFIRPGPLNHVCVIALAAAVAGMASTRRPELLLMVFLVWGCARGLLRVTSAVMVAEEKARAGARVGLASAVYNAGLDLGSLLAPAVTGAVAARIGIGASFQVLAVAFPLLYYAGYFGARRLAAPRKPDPASAQAPSSPEATAE